MRFHQRLKDVMREQGISQADLAKITGKSRGSVSQYMAGKQTPPEETRRAIASALGLEPDYFESDVLVGFKVKDRVIPSIDVALAARLMGLSDVTVRLGLQQRVFPWGYAIKTSENRWVYFINARKFCKEEGIGQAQL
ncbi:MAG: helix-turn-helix transcriptional regulator [Eubacteriales bacterium]|nr:helix-turn-helix transcriptional regulator [Eubacteriales bacterium]